MRVVDDEYPWWIAVVINMEVGSRAIWQHTMDIVWQTKCYRPAWRFHIMGSEKRVPGATTILSRRIYTRVSYDLICWLAIGNMILTMRMGIGEDLLSSLAACLLSSRSNT